MRGRAPRDLVPLAELISQTPGAHPIVSADELRNDAFESDEELEAFRPRLAERGLPDGMPIAELRQILNKVSADFRDKAPVTAAEAATVILDGIRSGAWRILIGKDAARLDRFVRSNPEATYDYAELGKSFQADQA